MQVIVNGLDDGDELLRYMNFAKFIYLIHNKKLYFPRADCLDDKYEGSYSKQLYEISRGILIESAGKTSNEGLHETTKTIRESAYVSCWTKSKYESMAHWDIYGEKYSVAIETTVGTLKTQLNGERANSGIYCFLEKEIESVEYVDHHSIDTSLARELLKNSKNPLKKKNVAFRYEEEVRVIYSYLHQSLAKKDFDSKLGTGIDVDIEPYILIRRIIVSPRSDNWFYALVVDLMSNYKLSERVEYSKLHVTPYQEVFDK